MARLTLSLLGRQAHTHLVEAATMFGAMDMQSALSEAEAEIAALA